LDERVQRGLLPPLCSRAAGPAGRGQGARRWGGACGAAGGGMELAAAAAAEAASEGDSGDEASSPNPSMELCVIWELSGEEADQDVFRFSEKAIETFNSSSEGKGLIWSFFFFSLFYMWPYQTMVQTQNFLVTEFPEKGAEAGATMMMVTTWPMFLTHTVLSLTGISRRLPYACKIVLPCCVVAVLAAVLIAILHMPSRSPDLLLNSLYVAGFVESLAESFVEPAVYEMAGLLPSTLTSQKVQAGNGACGLIVSSVQILTRLVTSGLGPIGKDQLEMLTTIFVTLMGVTSLQIMVLYFWKVRRSNYYWTYVRGSGHSPESRAEEIAEDASDLQDDFGGGCIENLRNTAKALRYVLPSFLAVFVCFLATLSVWPVIPGLSCAVPPSSSSSSKPDRSSALQSWWFDLVLFTFNFSDFLGKCMQSSLQWGARTLSPRTQLLLALLRAVVLVPVILACSAPQQFDPRLARWVNLFAVFVLGLTNGWLSTVCFMRAPKALPPDTPNAVAEQASSVMVIGLFLGISMGCLVADQLGKTALKGHIGVCFVPEAA